MLVKVDRRRGAEGFCSVSELAPRGMITLRGDLSAKKLQAAAMAAAGVKAFPGRLGAVVEGERAILWFSPDELLILCPKAEVGEALEKLGKALKGTHHLAADVSDARAIFAVAGKSAREVLAKLTPADVSPEALPAGMVRRSRLAQVPAAFWPSGEDRFEIIAFRSVADYVFELLATAARTGGEVGWFAR
ncbi:sarcosine oxidase subunit gamma [Meinhardsimonia xiamenensis]|jgi:sarcosine oxidase subunit gamma|uniref:Sarcosine oxidase subunit gamma n=1 Tax=Meinhardsimonia xiamenensis TaxID=990712 RepID=A0A1G9F8F9_9RHOB|nr:sarcosine oxidase subunit gamma family protein [Meinhardsimonia xiamenensis]PRX37944.1 sarcosine oxidase subunit gamma [Meinhardsimonia xiamenensis]SDK84697.1 sarcosine oxidase subunit gamma [Meinhardsimonia xiamenensis]